MFAAGSAYPFSCRPEDVWEALLTDQENYFFVDVQAKNPLRAIRGFHRKAGKIGGEQNTLLQLVKFYDPQKAGMSGISGQSGNRLRRPGQQAAKIGI